MRCDLAFYWLGLHSQVQAHDCSNPPHTCICPLWAPSEFYVIECMCALRCGVITPAATGRTADKSPTCTALPCQNEPDSPPALVSGSQRSTVKVSGSHQQKAHMGYLWGMFQAFPAAIWQKSLEQCCWIPKAKLQTVFDIVPQAKLIVSQPLDSESDSIVHRLPLDCSAVCRW